jgi:hypothetical protein
MMQTRRESSSLPGAKKVRKNSKSLIFIINPTFFNIHIFIGEEWSGPCNACQKKIGTTNLHSSNENLILPGNISVIKPMNHRFGKCGWDALAELLQFKDLNHLTDYLKFL